MVTWSIKPTGTFGTGSVWLVPKGTEMNPIGLSCSLKGPELGPRPIPGQWLAGAGRGSRSGHAKGCQNPLDPLVIPAIRSIWQSWEPNLVTFDLKSLSGISRPQILLAIFSTFDLTRDPSSIRTSG